MEKPLIHNLLQICSIDFKKQMVKEGSHQEQIVKNLFKIKFPNRSHYQLGFEQLFCNV